jgi:hypothetical protein
MVFRFSFVSSLSSTHNRKHLHKSYFSLQQVHVSTGRKSTDHRQRMSLYGEYKLTQVSLKLLTEWTSTLIVLLLEQILLIGAFL